MDRYKKYTSKIQKHKKFIIQQLSHKVNHNQPLPDALGIDKIDTDNRRVAAFSPACDEFSRVKAKGMGAPGFVAGSTAMQKTEWIKLVGCAVLLANLFPGPRRAHSGIFVAYIDPGTGSLIIQMVLAVLVGAGFAVKIFWIKIKTFFSKVFAKKRDDSDK